MGQLFDERHNPSSASASRPTARATLLEFWQKIDPATGALVHDFTDPEWDTRFLGDLYQDLSEAARKSYALLQTPEFVEEFILDRTLEPAIEEFGYQAVRLIDPACGSGHFLLGAFAASSIAGSRTSPAPTPAPWPSARSTRPRRGPQPVRGGHRAFPAAGGGAPGLRGHAAWPTRPASDQPGGGRLAAARPASRPRGPRASAILLDEPTRATSTRPRTPTSSRRILGQRYHAVVGNPPYITPKDAALNQAYRDASARATGSTPRGAVHGALLRPRHRAEPAQSPAGFVGMITANSFMKREFGKKLIEEFIPRWDLTHVIDTSGAYIPGHGTPTVILFGRHRRRRADRARRHGHPWRAADAGRPCQGARLDGDRRADRPSGSQSEFVSVADLRASASTRTRGASAAAALPSSRSYSIDAASVDPRPTCYEAIGFGSITRRGRVSSAAVDRCASRTIAIGAHSASVEGEDIRDWSLARSTERLFPYDARA